jgi:hypothetical protein
MRGHVPPTGVEHHGVAHLRKDDGGDAVRAGGLFDVAPRQDGVVGRAEDQHRTIAPSNPFDARAIERHVEQRSKGFGPKPRRVAIDVDSRVRRKEQAARTMRRRVEHPRIECERDLREQERMAHRDAPP